MFFVQFRGDDARDIRALGVGLFLAAVQMADDRIHVALFGRFFFLFGNEIQPHFARIFRETVARGHDRGILVIDGARALGHDFGKDQIDRVQNARRAAEITV